MFITVKSVMNIQHGRSDRTWTCSILLPKQARYQLRHTSKYFVSSLYILTFTYWIVKAVWYNIPKMLVKFYYNIYSWYKLFYAFAVKHWGGPVLVAKSTVKVRYIRKPCRFCHFSYCLTRMNRLKSTEICRLEAGSNLTF